MSRSIRATYLWDAEAMVAAHRAHRRQQCRPIFRWAVVGLLAFTALGGLLVLYQGGPSLPAIAMILVGLGWPVVAPALERWVSLRHFRTRTDQDTKVECHFSEEEVTSHSAIGSSTVRWGAFARLVETDDAFLLYMNDRIYYWIPKTAFGPGRPRRLRPARAVEDRLPPARAASLTVPHPTE